MSRGPGPDFMKLLQKEKARSLQEKKEKEKPPQDRAPEKRNWTTEVRFNGLVMRGCKSAECETWKAQGQRPAGAEHPTGYSLDGSFYRSDAEWERAIKTSIAFARAQKPPSEAILIASNCGFAPAESADRYRLDDSHDTLRKKQIPEGAVYLAYATLAGITDDEAAAWVIARIQNLHNASDPPSAIAAGASSSSPRSSSASSSSPKTTPEDKTGRK
jgi:hypothetical protein